MTRGSSFAPRSADSTLTEELSAVVETKYLVGLSSHAALRLLERLLPRDPIFPVGRVHTVYYDRPGDRSFGAGGFYRQGKLRLRWYTDLSGTAGGSVDAYLEAKCRDGGLRRKFRLPVQLPGDEIEQRPLDSLQVRRLAHLGSALSPLIPPLVVPALLVSYRRDRFLHPPSGSRIALDSEICCPAWAGCSLPGRAARLSSVILETKTPGGGLPLPLRAMASVLDRQDFSKYFYFRSRLLNAAAGRVRQ